MFGRLPGYPDASRVPLYHVEDAAVLLCCTTCVGRVVQWWCRRGGGLGKWCVVALKIMNVCLCLCMCNGNGAILT